MSARPAPAVIGAGPRGTGLVERLAANAPALYGDRPLDLHLVDPHPPGSGRIRRRDQSPLLWTNSMAEDVTMFTDDTVRQEGPVREGPALDAWAADVREGRTRCAEAAADPRLRTLYADGAAATASGLLAVDPGDGRTVDRAGRPHPRCLALGPHTGARTSGAFTRPRTGGPAFGRNDATARATLVLLRRLHPDPGD